MGGGASTTSSFSDDVEDFVTLHDHFHLSPLIHFATHNNAKRKYLNRQESFLSSELLLACQQGNLQEVKKLLKGGHDVNEVDKYGRTPLIHACEKGSCDIARLLIDNKANINIQEKRYGKTALIFASMQGNERLLSVLLSGGADINLVDKFGKSALYQAIELHHPSIVFALLAVSAKTDSQNDVGRTALLEVSSFALS